MMIETLLSPEMIDALELVMREAVQGRIDTDPDVAEAIRRLTESCCEMIETRLCMN